MKKLLIVMVLGLCLSLGYIGQANAVPSIPWSMGELNFVTDNSAEYLLNKLADGTYATDNGDTILDEGDRLRGMFEIDDLSYSSTTIDLTSVGIELTGVFDLEVTYKSVDPVLTVGAYDYYVYEFGPTATFEADFGNGAMMAWYLDDYGDGDDYNRLSPNDDTPGSIDEELRIDTAETSGAGQLPYYWSFGFLGLDGEGWETTAFGAPEDVSYFHGIPSTQGGGSGNLALNLINNPHGPELMREITSPFGDDVDFAATTGFIGISDQDTPMDLFDNFDGALKPVPEPATMLLLGSGLLGLAGLGRKKFFKKG